MVKGFDEVILKLLIKRNCSLLSHKGNIIEIKTQHISFCDDLAYFYAVCDCYMATNYGSTAWVSSINLDECIIELGYNY